MLQVTDVQAVIGRAAERVGPAVAGLERGSGIVIAENRVLTSAHVLRTQELRISLGGQAIPARVIGVDAEVGVAVLAAATGDIAPVEWAAADGRGAADDAVPGTGGGPDAHARAAGDAAPGTGGGPDAHGRAADDAAPGTGVRLGTPVLALADPGGRGLRVTLGHVAAATRPVRGPRGRRIAGAIEHTAPLPRGAAGGPLVDLEGRLLGVNASRLEGGFILALPADAAMRARLAALAQGLTPARPRLGLALARPRNRADGLVVRAVEDASPAAVAGIARGDLLVAVEGRPVHSVDDLFEALEASTGALTLTIVRNRAERDTELHILQ